MDSGIWAGAQLNKLPQDASFRSYWRAQKGENSAIVMDAPPPLERVDQFVHVTELLARSGVRVPEIYQRDPDRGLLLLEDFGRATFSVLLADGVDELALYSKALSALNTLQNFNDDQAGRILLPDYNFDITWTELSLFTDWYVPAVTGNLVSDHDREDFKCIWRTAFENLPELPSVIVHRDFHVDNLMLVDDTCSLLDYQDALIGSPAYDLVSLLEDARRDIDPDTVSTCYQKHLADLNASAQTTRVFDLHMAFWGAQRHLKVAGIFVRLWLRDQKSVYLKHLVRVLSMARRAMQGEEFSDLRKWLDDHYIPQSHPDFHADAEEIRSILMPQSRN